jgi:hypothetical protein
MAFESGERMSLQEPTCLIAVLLDSAGGQPTFFEQESFKASQKVSVGINWSIGQVKSIHEPKPRRDNGAKTLPDTVWKAYVGGAGLPISPASRGPVYLLG